MTNKFITKDSGKRKEFSTGMRRDLNAGKVRYSLCFPDSMKEPMIKRWAELMGRGASKYGERNWEKAGTQEELDRFKDSAMRHFMQWYLGDSDEDHAAAVFFNLQGAEYVKEKLNKDNK